MARHVYLIYLIQISILAANSGAEIEIECDLAKLCKNVGDKVLDPANCRNYYVCIKTNDSKGPVPSDNPLPCPKGKYFDTSDNECRKEEQPCGSPCANRQCKTECVGGELNAIPYPGDCGKYYLCIPGQNTPSIVECPEDKPFFNGTSCTPNEYSCCDMCHPYCEKQYTETINPKNCTQYYLCEGDYTLPTDDQLFSCAKNMYFSSTDGHCVEYKVGDKDCESLC